MQRIEVTPTGISVTNRTEPLVSIFGREMRPGVTDVITLPWNEIVSASITTTELPPGGTRRADLEIDVLWGECLTVNEAAEGFAQAVHELGRLPVAGHRHWPDAT